MYDKCPGCHRVKDADNLRCWLCQFENISSNGIDVYRLRYKENFSSIMHDFISIPHCQKRPFHSFYERKEVPSGASDPWFEELKDITCLSEFDIYLNSKGIYTIPTVCVFFNRKYFEEISPETTKIKLSFFNHESVVYGRDELVMLRNGKVYMAHEIIVGDIITNAETNGLKVCGIEKQ